VMVTHDPTAASYADRVVFLVASTRTGYGGAPTAPAVLDTMARLAKKEG